MKQPMVVFAAGAAVVAFTAAYFGSPILALHDLSQAARSGDRDRLEQAIDFPAVRSTLKDQVSAAMLRSTQGDPAMQGNLLSGLAMLFAPALIDRMVDTYVTPDAIAVMLTTARKPGSGSEESADAAPPPGLRTRYAYLGLDRFRARISSLEQPDTDPIGMIFDRRGLFSWKLVRIDLPVTPPASSARTAELLSPMAKGRDCSQTRVTSTGFRFADTPDSGSEITYANGVRQVSYDSITGIAHARTGDAIDLCVVWIPTGCPPGDNRGISYRATDLRTHETWTAADSTHSCGGA